MADLQFVAAIFLASLAVTLLSMPFLIRKLFAAGMTGRDVNKRNRPSAAEMGGLGIIMGVIAALLLAIAFNTFFCYEFELIEVLAAMLTIMIVALIGTFDDLFTMRKDVKTILPMVAALPLVAVSAAGSTAISIPFIGLVDFGIIYIVVLIPLGVTVSANLTNMLAGFNGMEAGMGAVIFAATLLLSLANGSVEMAIFSAAMLGALLAFLRFNWFPAKVFMGDIGTLAIGTSLAATVIIGNLEAAGAILVIPYLIDFAIKAWNRFPSKNWWGRLKNGKLYAPGGKVRGAAQLVMKAYNGVSEQKLVLTFIVAQGLCALLVIILYSGIFN